MSKIVLSLMTNVSNDVDTSFQQEKDLGVCEHPLSDIVIAGEAAHPLPHTFHRLLQTISDLMMSLPSGSSLQQMALRYETYFFLRCQILLLLLNICCAIVTALSSIETDECLGSHQCKTGVSFFACGPYIEKSKLPRADP